MAAKRIKHPTQKYLKECFDYDSSTGNLIWKNRPLSHFENECAQNITNSMMCGKVAGSKDKHPKSDTLYYVIIKVNNKDYYAHCLIWIWLHGELPDDEVIDHDDGDGTNNREINLIKRGFNDNVRKGKMRNDNISGFRGVSYIEKRNKWKSAISINNIKIQLGYFDDVIIAARYYATAFLIHSGEKYKFNSSSVIEYNNSEPEYIKIKSILHNKLNNIKTIRPDNTSGITGVYFLKRDNKWIAKSLHDGKYIPHITTADKNLAIRYIITADVIFGKRDINDEQECFNINSKEYKEIKNKINEYISKFQLKSLI
ncbi:hypothetical protein DIDNDMLP_00419 [Klebsiella phage KP13-7]|nr:hypothetical protein DIDNDMLP_00419 [Klebsiella phage KP13-7]